MQIPNYTQISNEFIEAMPELSGAAVKVGLAIFRKTIGWHKNVDRIGYSQLKKMTGLTTNAIKKAIKQLVDKNFIVQIEGKTGFEYDINVSKKDIDIDEGCQKVIGGVSKNDTEGYQKMTPQKKGKKLIKKKESLSKKIQAEYISRINEINGKLKLSQKDFVLLAKFVHGYGNDCLDIIRWFFEKKEGEWCAYTVSGLVSPSVINKYYLKNPKKDTEKLEKERKKRAVKKNVLEVKSEIEELENLPQTETVKTDLEFYKQKLKELEGENDVI